MQHNLKNKKVLITGAAGGIGRALCSKFIENGCIFIMCLQIIYNLESKLKKVEYPDEFIS